MADEVVTSAPEIAAPTPEPAAAPVADRASKPGKQKFSERMVELASQQPGFLGAESARNEVGITVSYWKDLESIRAWKANAEHLEAQRLGHAQWYSAFTTRVAKVERDYSL